MQAASAAATAERAACEARFAAALAAATAAGLPAPFRGPAADSRLGERFLDIIALVSANGFALDARPTRFLCGLTLREGARRADGSLDRAGFAGGPADMIRRALEQQAPWLRAARAAPREDARLHGVSIARTTSLMRAAAAGDEQRVRELLAAGAPLCCIDDQQRDRWTALHHASRQGSTQVVAALLAADTTGATVDVKTDKGDTALILASHNGHEGAVRLLLARGARQELQDKKGWSALHSAAVKGHAGVVEQLCAAPGAAVALALRTSKGSTPLVISVSSGGGGEFLVAVLLEADAQSSTIDAQDNNGSTALTWACREGHEGAVRLLLARGARQELQNKNGHTALHLAAYKGHAGVVELLCAAPGAAAALALRDQDGSTPLILAVSEGGGGERLVTALLAADTAGASVDTQTMYGSTALILASWRGHEGAVRLLLARGARQELQNEHGLAALHCAAEKGHAGVVELLCAAPGAAAALALRDKEGRTPLALAVDSGTTAIAAVLRALGAAE
jgi:ankyrin repeat protein